MKFIFSLILAATLTSCACTENQKSNIVYGYTTLRYTEFKDELNASVIEGFYDNDTTGKSHKIYMLK